MRPFYLFVILISYGCFSGANAQLSFVNATEQLPNRPFVGVLSKAMVDLNDDGYDDIVRTNSKDKALSVLINDGTGKFSEVISRLQGVRPVSTTVADVNNDGQPDLLTGGYFDGITIWRNLGNNRFLTDTLKTPVVWMQGANLVDVNNDGWLDYFACHDVGLNQLWKNDKQGGFTPITDWIDMRTVPVSDNSGNYGSVWSDIDNDGDLDLYLAKCSMKAMGAENAGDPRRINQLFINHTYDRINGQIVKSKQDFDLDPSGWFTEEAAAYNVKISGQSWSADFADIDNDGDQDLLVTNHELPTMLLLNDGTGHFSDITTESGLKNIVDPLQGLMRDFDNDGYVDILLTGDMTAQLWRNNGDHTFTKMEPFGSTKTTSFAVGDINHDGFLDVYTSHYPKADAEDEVWLNQKNTNHFVGITLQGTVSNRDGVGAKVIVELDDGTKRLQEVRAGESYGISNTLTQIVGLGQNTTIHRIEVKWPSGQISELKEPKVDQFMTMVEPICGSLQCIPLSFQLIKQ